ncbi:2-oxoacid ferredoxin oxidoreductase [Candidatus Peregrinibacteria bacterium]|nr:2-oxoacid ferredoxin oxidoreductase [Candidatus Peregrinibacteria bacterium]
MTNNTIETLQKNKDLYGSYESKEVITWCSGCGNYGIQNALKRAFTLENLDQKDVVLCYDIGCHGNGSDKIDAFTIHGLHGRVISLAAGVATANPKLNVIAHGGDGGTLSEGVNHLIHAIRSNYKVLFLHHNNSNYALTTGQPSSTTPLGQPMNSAPDGVYIDPLNPLDLVLSLNPGFVARTFSGDINHMTEMFRKGLNHNGFAFVEILQVCPTYSRTLTKEWYTERVRDLAENSDYDPTNLEQAKKVASEIEKEIGIGLIYHNPERKEFTDLLPNRQGVETAPVEEVKRMNIQNLLKEFE